MRTRLACKVAWGALKTPRTRNKKFRAGRNLLAKKTDWTHNVISETRSTLFR